MPRGKPSVFYSSKLGRSTQFKRRKRAFKEGKPCAICGRSLPTDELMVAHKKPVRELSDYEAIYDETNWEVRCVRCERLLNRIEDIERMGTEESKLGELPKLYKELRKVKSPIGFKKP